MMMGKEQDESQHLIQEGNLLRRGRPIMKTRDGFQRSREPLVMNICVQEEDQGVEKAQEDVASTSKNSAGHKWIFLYTVEDRVSQEARCV